MKGKTFMLRITNKISLSVFMGLSVAAALALNTGCKEKTPAPSSEQGSASMTQQSPASPMAAPVASMPTDPAAVIAVVDGEKITAGAVNEEVSKMMNRFGNRMPPERLAQMRDQMVEQAKENLILRTLLTNQVKKENVTVTEEEIKTAVDQFKQSLPEGMTMDDLMKQAGMSQEEFNKNITLDLSVNKLLTKVTESIPQPTDEQIKAFYDENKERFSEPETVNARHILISVEPTDDDAAKAAKKAKAEEIQKQLAGGADFAALATEKSDCPSKAKGGDLGSFSRGQMVKPFEDAAFSQKVNEIGPVVETQFGYHIIQVTDHKQAGTNTLEEMKDRISKILLSQERQKAAQKYIEGLKEKATISYPDATAKS
jgi:peptidyl-prolyl cis-trans isomerase C